jgi:geranylgeranyl reductase family protein
MQALPDGTSYDVVIVGMGPAGAAAAYELGRSEMSVLALEKQTHPRYKVCGGGLSVRIDRLLEPDFKSVIEHTVSGVHFTYRGRDPIFIESVHPFAYMVMRDRFDHFLADKARRVGVEIHECESALNFRQSADGVEVLTDRGRYRAKALIGADGANSLVAQRLFPKRKLRRLPALESELNTGAIPSYPGERTALIDIGAISQGYAWIFPKKGRLSIGIAGRTVSPKENLQSFLRTDTGLAEFRVPPPYGHPLPLYAAGDSAASLVHGRALLVGDAGHLVDPLFGEGIYYAVRSGQMAAASILRFLKGQQETFMDYGTAVEHEIYPEFSVASRLATIVYTFPRLCHRLLHRYQDVIRLYYDVLGGQETYQTFLAKAKGTIKRSVPELLREALHLG